MANRDCAVLIGSAPWVWFDRESHKLCVERVETFDVDVRKGKVAHVPWAVVPHEHHALARTSGRARVVRQQNRTTSQRVVLQGLL